MLGDVEDKVNTLLRGDSSDEGEERNSIIKISKLEVLHLKSLLSSEMVRGGRVEFLDSLWDGNTVGEGEWIGLLLEEPA